MIQPLRKIHRRVFPWLAVLLPLLFLAGLHARHRVLTEKVDPRIPSSAVAVDSSDTPIAVANFGAAQ
ncbi:MAG TPA: hypothetical protein VJX70_13505 [Candidatus Acidoferrum sp.]|nr:hypothetical protein [Candidatus Acidoferrum sp.]